MEIRKIGNQGLSAAAIGLGCMGMTHAYGTRDDNESIATIHRALDCGVTLLDTAEVYGPYTNEELVGKAIRGRRDGVVIATKFGIALGAGDVSPGDQQRAAAVVANFADAGPAFRDGAAVSAGEAAEAVVV